MEIRHATILRISTIIAKVNPKANATPDKRFLILTATIIVNVSKTAIAARIAMKLISCVLSEKSII